MVLPGSPRRSRSLYQRRKRTRGDDFLFSINKTTNKASSSRLEDSDEKSITNTYNPARPRRLYHCWSLLVADLAIHRLFKLLRKATVQQPDPVLKQMPNSVTRLTTDWRCCKESSRHKTYVYLSLHVKFLVSSMQTSYWSQIWSQAPHFLKPPCSSSSPHIVSHCLRAC